jgi:hypothetical protein
MRAVPGFANDLCSRHYFGAERVHRQRLDTTGLPEYRTKDHRPLVDRWMKIVGKLPD